MAGSTQNAPVPYRVNAPINNLDFHVSELASEHPGASSPFGDDVEFPLPVHTLSYAHPSKADRPHLAGE